MQEPITRSMQLPYSVCETVFSQVSLFLDQPFPGISLRYFSITVRSFHFFWICLKVYLTITKAREKLTKHGFSRANSHSEKCIKLKARYKWNVQIKLMVLWEDQFKE